MNIQYGFRDAVYVGKYNISGYFDYVAVFLVKQNPFQELISSFKNDGSTVDIQSPVASLFGKTSGGNQASFYNDSLKNTSSYPSNYVKTAGDYATYYTAAAREAFLQTICKVAVWDNYGIKEAVCEANPALEYKSAKGITSFNGSSIVQFNFAGDSHSFSYNDGSTVFEDLCNYALSVYGNATITGSKSPYSAYDRYGGARPLNLSSYTDAFTYLSNDLGYNIILVPVKQSAVIIPSEVSSNIDVLIEGTTEYKQSIGEIVSSAYSTVSCINTVFRGDYSSVIHVDGYNQMLNTFVFDTTQYSFGTNLYFIDRTKGTVPESRADTENVTIQSISDFTSLVTEYEAQDKVSVFRVHIDNDFEFFYPAGEYNPNNAKPKGEGKTCYNTVSIFYTAIYEPLLNSCISFFNCLKVSVWDANSVKTYTRDGVTRVSAAELALINARDDKATDFLGIKYMETMPLWERHGWGHNMDPDWNADTSFSHCLYFINNTSKYVASIGILGINDTLMSVVPDDSSVQDEYEFGVMLHLGVAITHSVGPTIYVDDSVLDYVGTNAIPDAARYPSLSASNTFGNGFLYADLVIPPNKSSVSQLNIYNKNSYSLSYIIAKNNLVVLFDPSDLFVYAKNVSTSDSAKYECYACTRKAIVAGYNSKVYIESAVSTSGEVDIRAAASDTSEDSNIQFAYTTLVGTPFTELFVNSMLINLLMYTGYVDHAFYDTELVTLIDGVYTTVSSLIGQYYYVCICFPNTTDVCILKVDSQTSTVEGKTGYKVTICDSADVASLFVNGEAIVALNNSNAVCQFSNGNPVIHVDGYTLVIDTNFTNGQSYFMFGLNSDSGDTSEFAIALSTKLTYNCNCKVPVLSVDSVNTSILNVTDGIVTFTINNIPVTLNSNTGVLYYSDDVFELDCSIDEVSGIFEYMKYCTISSVFYGVYKVTSADSALYTVTSDGVILNDLDFSVEEIDE